MNQQTTLVTGGTGFVGSHLLPLLDRAILTTRNVQRAQQKIGGDENQFLKGLTNSKLIPQQKSIPWST